MMNSISRWLPAIGALSLIAGCAPKSQEECSATAAKDAKNPASLQVLLEQCQREFPARKRDDGTYAYYDAELAEWVDVSGPKLSASDVGKLQRLRAKRKFENDIKSHDLGKLNITEYNIKCGIDDRYIACYDKNITIKLKNSSSRKISGLHFEYEIGRHLDCSGSLGKTFVSPISIGPGETGSLVQNVAFAAAGPEGVMAGCVRLVGADNVE